MIILSYIYIYIGSPSGPSKVPELYRYTSRYTSTTTVFAWTVADPSAPVWVLHAGGNSRQRMNLNISSLWLIKSETSPISCLWHAKSIITSTIIAIGCHWYRHGDVTWCNFHQWFGRPGTKRPCWALLACCRSEEKVGLRCRGRWEIPTHRTKMEDF